MASGSYSGFFGGAGGFLGLALAPLRPFFRFVPLDGVGAGAGASSIVDGAASGTSALPVHSAVDAISLEEDAVAEAAFSAPMEDAASSVAVDSSRFDEANAFLIC